MIAHSKIGTAIVALITLVGAGVVTQLEGRVAIATVSIMKAAVDEEQLKQVEILRDHITMLWLAGGAFLGSYVGASIRKITGLYDVIKYTGVSFATSLACMPYVIRRWFHGQPEECFLGGFLAAVFAWLVWEIVLILAARLKDTAIKRGWLGIKDEVLKGVSGGK